MTPVVSLVLAAGRSRRMGTPKALVEDAGVGLLRAHLDLAAALGARRIVVVGRDAAAIRAAHRQRDIVWTHNIATARGPFSSLILGLCAARGAACLVSPVDAPAASRAVVDALRAACDAGAWAALPEVRTRGVSRGGHPVWLTVDGVRQVLATPGAPSRLRLDYVLREWGDHVRRVPVRDAAVLRNLNTPGDLR